ncbi:NAD(P)-dependent alcohol dehydrogenase [Tunturiibacter empetritectus]|uniref:NADPH:quinone reductase-like Zn-dependent oxidoreductase n=1 Tax=Tunturiibacter lichenicola TaxID=2051959 RepID=A0A852VK15_9BACT|nr:NAD(P)-dependent alcohol dehydrogenase [Edaphobacter lichenicola]NYF91529.1 NADPH:quinone reductase-like Zn-dependent oxidoreductase [Edaphobacter lichenicola]
MKVIELAAPRVDALHSCTYPDPVPGPAEVLVRLRAASLNFLDIAVATGKYPLNNFPIIPVTDGAGEIAAIGAAVTDWTVGERVIPHFIPNWQDGRMPTAGGGPRRGIDLPGSLAEYVVVPAHSLVHTPAHLSHAEAATLPIAATTAWRAVRTAGLGPHKTALVLGTGGVSLFAMQFARAHGARVLVTSSSDEKLERARKLGADEIINYKFTPKWADAVLRLTDGRGADLVLETGGAATFPQSIEAAGLDSTVFIIGFLSGTEVSINVVPVMERRIRLQGNNTGPVADFADAAAAMTAHGIKPVLDATFPMDQAQAAYRHLAEGGHFGKIAISIP